MKYPNGVHKYKIDEDIVYAEYMGKQNGFECCICGKGHNAYTFNILHGKDEEECLANYANDDYETWGFGVEHLNDYVKLLED